MAWLKLGGRCRNCHARISARYPLIEALVASIFVLFYYRELLSGGANLPVRTPNMYNGIVWILLYTKWDLVTIYLFHMLLLALLLAWGMINYDRFRVPRYASLGMIALSVGLASVFPFLNPIASDWESPIAGLPSAFAASLFGCVIGGLAGAAFEWGTNFFNSSGARVAAKTPTAVAREPLPHAREFTGEPEFESATQAGSGSFNQKNADYSVEKADYFVENGAESVENGAESALETDAECSTGTDAEAPRLPSDPYGKPAEVPAWGSNAIVSGALVGSQLGLQAVLAIFALTVVLYVAGKLVADRLRQWRAVEFREIPITLMIFVITLAYLVFWKQADQFFNSIFIGLGVHMQA